MMQLIGSIRSEDGFSNTSGCEADITFGKSASEVGKFSLLVSGGSARTRDQSDICKNIF